MFACRNPRERNVVGPYYGSVTYETLEKELQVAKKHGEEYMETTPESF